MVWIVTRYDGSIDSVWTTEAGAAGRVAEVGLSGGLMSTPYHTDHLSDH